MGNSPSIDGLLTRHFRARVELARRLELAACAGVIVQRSGTRPIVTNRLPAVSELERGMKLERTRSRFA